MHKLMLGRLMDVAADATGMDGGATVATDTGGKEPQVGSDSPADDPKPILGGQNPQDGEGVSPVAAKGDGGAEKAEAKAFEEKDYVDGVVKDEALLGEDKNVELDKDLVKAMVPTFKEVGLSPEQTSKLANALAKAQIDQARAYAKERQAYFKANNDAAMEKYDEGQWKQINAGIDAAFRPDGIMNRVVRNSELGADPEFLELMLKVGAEHMTDGVAGAAAGTGVDIGDGGSYSGISRLWK